MNEFVRFMENYLRLVQRTIGELSEEEAASVNSFVREALQFIQTQQAAAQPIEAPTPIGTELLWHLANGNPEAFVNYLRTVPDPALNQLLANPVQLTQTIENLAERFPQAPPEQVANVERAPLNSSNIWGFNYDPSSGTLRVRFQGDGIYQYEGVPPYIFKIFQSGAVPAKTSGQNQYGRWWVGKQPSLGASFYDLIRSGPYPYHKVA